MLATIAVKSQFLGANREINIGHHRTLPTVTTHGVETQIYRKQAGKWRLVHVHYSEDREVAP
jgi:hypothetical protein